MAVATMSGRRVALLAVLSLLGLAAVGSARTMTVKAGDKIQAALDKADPGDKIVVQKGTYAECLTITKDGICLEGQRGAVLQPPAACATNNTCTGLAGPGTSAGICIAGTVAFDTGPFNGEHTKVDRTIKPVKNVRVSGMTVQAVLGLNIAVVGGQGVLVSDNTVTNGSNYGILTVGSTGTRIRGNTVGGADVLQSFVGICMDDKSADVEVRRNDVSDKVIGLCVQTSGATLAHNKVHACCVGAYVDPAIRGARLLRNRFLDANKACAGSFLGPLFFGVLISGATETEVAFNRFRGMTDYGLPTMFAAGIAVADGPPGTNAIAVGNKIHDNFLRDNDFDIGVNTTGTNYYYNNHCTLGAPGLNICSGK